MTHSRLKERWDAGEVAYGGWLMEGYDRAVEAYELAGFDYVGFDCQHSLLDEAAAGALIRRFSSPEHAMIARANSQAPAGIGKLLDAGADAVIVPMVNNPEEAARIVEAFRYPPRGGRSFGPILSGMGAGPAEIEARALCIVMIETAEGLEKVDEIAAVDGVDGFYVGPADLSIGLGLPYAGAFTTDQLVPAFERIRAACDKHGVVLGAHASSADSAHRWVDLGCQFVSLNSNIALLTSAARQLHADLRGRAAAAGTDNGPYN